MINKDDFEDLFDLTNIIPQDWDICPIKTIVATKITDGPHETPELEETGVPFISAEAIKNDKIDFNLRRGFISKESHKQYSKKCKPQRNDIFIIKSGATTGNVAYVDIDFEFNIWSPLALVRCKEHLVYFKFLYYQFLSDIFRKQVELSWSFGTQENIGMRVIEGLKAIIPSVPEQRRIATYLDKTCAAIDTAIEKKQRQLAALDALGKSIIHKAVTRGLEDSVELMDSGIEWSKLKPAIWLTCRVKDIMDFFNTIRVPLSADIRGAMTDRIYEYYGASGVIDKVDDYLFDGTYILIAEDGANILARSSPLAFLATGKFWVNNHAHILKPRFGNIRYFVYLLESLDYSLYVTGAAQPKLTKENLGKYKIIVPPKTEQDVITNYLDAKTAELEELTQNIANQITALLQYRKSLIHECVTGKRRITEAHLKEIEAHV